MIKKSVRNLVSRANSKLTIKFAAIILASSTLLSSLLGFLRDRLLNSYYLDSYPDGIDAYTVAFTIPDFMFFILVSGALSVTFIPVFNQRMAKYNKKSAWELSSSVLNVLALLTLVTSILIIIFAEPLVKYIVGPGLSESSRSLAISMMRVIAINPFLFAIATVITSIQQAIGRFTFTALAPAIYNIGIIIGTIFFTNGINIFGIQLFEGGIMGVAMGVAFGSVLQLIIASVGLIGVGFDYQFKIFWKNKGFRKVMKLLPTRSMDQGLDYVNSIVETNMASRMGAGTVRAYQQGLTLHMMPINLIGVAISTAFFPNLTERLAIGRKDLFRKDLQSALRMITFLALPVAVLFFFLRGYVVSFIKNGGDTLIAGILGVLVISIFARSIYHIAARSFYAMEDTKTPLYISIFAIGLNILLAIVFSTVFKFGAYGLAWAQSIGALVEIIILLALMKIRIQGLFDIQFISGILRMVVASLVAGAVCYLFVVVFPLMDSDERFFSVFPKFCFVGLVSSTAYLFVSKILKLEEAEPIISYIKKIFLK
ncbi:murein biosynthesis integral membrane protein MurJ [Candidatus Nanogingivalis gingivitcus]|jgi:integral membrane protein mviN|uniref:Lipid II flippase n=1 Tax=Candidatus Nanogingivalis gingivitcus TaxID=2171992 RepID=A0ABY0FJ97_9BACT|nr:murein biosynthesis integral membrane protein MurJ [Candidatus Nanogingivalis gingivitcus]RYC73006.1 putative lipid II flippase MurJ [Candidatus Nanogingivalis gingivitcus]